MNENEKYEHYLPKWDNMIRSSMAKNEIKNQFSQAFIMIIYLGTCHFRRQNIRKNVVYVCFLCVSFFKVALRTGIFTAVLEITSRSKLTIFIGIEIKINQAKTRTIQFRPVRYFPYFSLVFFGSHLNFRLIEIRNEIVLQFLRLFPVPK